MPQTAIIIGKKRYIIRLSGKIDPQAFLETTRKGTDVSIRIGRGAEEENDMAESARREDGDVLDVSALNLIGTLSQSTINTLVAANAQLVASLTNITEKVVHGGTLEREALTVASTATESITAHVAGDAVGHEGHQTPLKQSGAETAGVPKKS